jgi:chaperonin GroEL
MSKQLLYKDKAREALLKGATILADAVITTLGPKGRNVAIDKDWGTPTVVHDGVTVARDIELKDKFQNMGAQLVKEAASKTNDTAGDGTTTSTLLAYSMIVSGVKQLSNGANPMIIKKGMDKASKAVIAELKKYTKDVSDDKDILHIATISAQNEEIGKTIHEAIKKVGRDGVISVEEGKGIETSLSYTEGMEFDNGYVSSYFVTDKAKMVSEIKKPYILITDRSISSANELLPFLNAFVAGQNKDLVIICDNMDNAALATMIINTSKGLFNSVVVRAPYFGDRRKEFLEDLAALTGAKVVSNERGDKLEQITSIGDWCGKADSVWVSNDTCRIVGGQGDPQKIEARIAELRDALDKSEVEYDKEFIHNRLAKLTSGAAVINVGAPTEIEMKDAKERVIDAVSATKSAIEEGVVPGGGITLFKARKAIKRLRLPKVETLGAQIVYDALEQPLRVILYNAGENTELIMAKIARKTNKKYWEYGYNVLSEQFEYLYQSGVVDPAKVVRLELQNAVSVASMILTTDCLITNEVQEQSR